MSVVGAVLVWTSLSVAVPTPGVAAALGTSAHTRPMTTTSTSTTSTSTSLPTLARGARGEAVATLQRALIGVDIEVRGGADGIFGPATETALQTFQSDSGLQPTGRLDSLTAHLLDLGPAPDFVTRGDRGDEVAGVQRALIGAGVTVRGGADGIFGPVTTTAIAKFQEQMGLEVSGRLDARTAIALGIAVQDEGPNVASSTGNEAAAKIEPSPTAVDPSSRLPRRGDRNEAVALVQRALLAAGVDVLGGADGVFGSATEGAVKFYQRNVRRPATGVVDETTAQLLGLLAAPTVPKRGDRGEEVATIQRALLDAGVTVRGGADGVFGSATESAITTFQSRLGLSSTGRLDLVTYFALVDGSTDTATGSTSKGPNGSSSAPITAEVFPVQGPCWFTDTWHSPRSGGRRHAGVDIIAPTGKAVYAVVDGMITRQWFDKPGSLGGNALRLTASDDTYFHYAHMSSFADGIALGSEVVAGQIIGYVGSTGSSSTPHLHFEYHPDGGQAVDPYKMVKAIDACKATELLPQPGTTTD